MWSWRGLGINCMTRRHYPLLMIVCGWCRSLSLKWKELQRRVPKKSYFQSQIIWRVLGRYYICTTKRSIYRGKEKVTMIAENKRLHSTCRSWGIWPITQSPGVHPLPYPEGENNTNVIWERLVFQCSEGQGPQPNGQVPPLSTVSRLVASVWQQSYLQGGWLHHDTHGWPEKWLRDQP